MSYTFPSASQVYRIDLKGRRLDSKKTVRYYIKSSIDKIHREDLECNSVPRNLTSVLEKRRMRVNIGIRRGSFPFTC